jgi:hypothetical protein
VTITEPTTLITDYLLAALSAAFGFLLIRSRTNRGTLLWAIGFLTLGGAGLTGGSFHGFRLLMSDSAHNDLWNITVLLIGVSMGFMVSGGLTGPHSRRGRNTRWIIAGLVVTAVGLVALQHHVSIGPDFNHNDLFHSVQMVALYCYFRGARMTA